MSPYAASLRAGSYATWKSKQGYLAAQENSRRVDSAAPAVAGYGDTIERRGPE